MYSALITDNPSPILVKKLNDYGIETTSYPTLTHHELKDCIHLYDALVIRSATKISEDVLINASKLKVIGRAGVGLDNINQQATNKLSITVINTPTASSRTTAEFNIGLLFSLARKIPQAHLSIHDNQWNRSQFTGCEIYGKTLGIIGFGNIGSIVCELASSLGLNVLAFDPFVSESIIQSKGGKKASFDTVIQSSDFISLHTTLNSKTEGMINRKIFKKMKNSAQIINGSRGKIMNEEDLIDALKTGEIQGAALDVFANEPHINKKLLNLPGIILTPHLGASSLEAQHNISLHLAQKVHDSLLNWKPA
ncbi:MAG TPA: hydroxyacid dehydrogenase [Gammaproteobacteria bacterium]|nr:hydroxyacid dehydrogenase [Gammaproteobacteria bacterium]